MKSGKANALLQRIEKLGAAIQLKHLAIAAVAVLILSLVPIAAVARFDRPAADDYFYSTGTFAAYSQTNSISAVLNAAIQETASAYQNWQGSFTAMFLFALQPGIWGQQVYAVTPFVMIGALAAGTIFLCYALFKRVFCAPRGAWIYLAAFLLIYAVQLAPSPVEGFFWYNGAVYYTLYHALAMLCVGFILCYCTSEKKSRYWLLGAAGLLALWVGGGNYLTALFLLVLLVAVLTVAFAQKNRNWKGILAVLCLLAVSLVISMLAPGNAVRQSGFAGHPSVFAAAFMAFKKAFGFISDWGNLPYGLSLMLLLPAFWSVAKNGNLRFRFPGVVTGAAVCVLAATIYAPIYATGGIGGGRTHNIAYFTFLLLSVFVAFYWFGWLYRALTNAKTSGGEALAAVWIGRIKKAALPLLLVVIVLFGMATLGVENHKRFTSYTSLKTWLNGEGAAYAAELDARLSVYTDAEDTATVPPLLHKPTPLFFDDITQNPDDWRNVGVSKYFGKASVVLSDG